MLPVYRLYYCFCTANQNEPVKQRWEEAPEKDNKGKIELGNCLEILYSLKKLIESHLIDFSCSY